MRYEDWDVLLFPKDIRTPMKEFKTNCHVVQDPDFNYTNACFGLPTMTCFIPSLAPGAPFSISMHSWSQPEISRFTRNYSQHVDLVKYEVRVFIDGRHVASSSFNRCGPFPHLLTSSFEFTKDGELEPLRFPQFRSELLRQSYWSPGDDLGRIKLIISEGFPRDSLTVPMERVKNVVAFSFQHAPIDILESSSIAWPNASMWRRAAFINPSSISIPTQHPDGGAETHLHSPRHQSDFAYSSSSSSVYSTGTGAFNSGTSTSQAGNIFATLTSPETFLQRAPNKGLSTNTSSTIGNDPWCHERSESSYLGLSNSNPDLADYQANKDLATVSFRASVRPKASRAHRHISSLDFSMPDYMSGTPGVGFRMLADEQKISSQFNAANDLDAGNAALKVPTNTPTALQGRTLVEELIAEVSRSDSSGCASTPSTQYATRSLHASQKAQTHPFTTKADLQDTIDASSGQNLHTRHASSAELSAELVTSLTQSLLNQPTPLPLNTVHNIHRPASEVKSRKENRFGGPQTTKSTPLTALNHLEQRKVSQFGHASPMGAGQDQQIQHGKEILSRETSITNSPQPSSRSFSGVFSHRSGSNADLGLNVANTNAFIIPVLGASTALASSKGETLGTGNEKGTKRTRDFTPGNTEEVEDEEELKRSSPRVKIGFGPEGNIIG